MKGKIYVMVCNGVYIAPQKLSGIALTHKREEAQKWTEKDLNRSCLRYFQQVTKLDFQFETL